MPNSRRRFLNRASTVLMAALAACRKADRRTRRAPVSGRPVPRLALRPRSALRRMWDRWSRPPPSPKPKSWCSFHLSPAEREQAAGNWRKSMAALVRTPHRTAQVLSAVVRRARYALGSYVAGTTGQPRTRSLRSNVQRQRSASRATMPDIAFAPLSQLSRWIETRQLTSERLTHLYLDRLQRFDPKLNCVITLTSDLALSQAQQADREIAAGHYRGPLHGIPWGGKDLLDTAGIATTYGAEPYRNRVPHAGCRGCEAPARRGSRAGCQAEPGRAGAQ